MTFDPSKAILVTGGAGYIGSHTCVALLAQGYLPVIVDNLCNSHPAVLERIARLGGRAPVFCQADVRDGAALADILARYPVRAAIHFAGLKAVGESVAEPAKYYSNNVEGSLRLCEAMAAAGVKRLIFSSSATVYGDPAQVPIREDAPIQPTNPYGRSKAMVEQMLGDLALADSAWQMGILRYFNPVGAHPSGLLGEDPRGIPNNLMPFIAQVAVGRRERLSVFGADYPTPDGTGVRDYIHVMDLAAGHVAALRRLEAAAGSFTVNLGTGVGISVLDMVAAFAEASGCVIPYQMSPRRPGDIATCYADPAAAQALLGWRTELGLDAMCRDSWRWQEANPEGYAGAA